MRVLLAAAVQHDYRPFANGEQVLLFGGKTAMIKGDFYMLTQDGPWRKGSLEASIKGEKMEGSFEGFEAIRQITDTGLQIIFCPITNGKFTATRD